MIAALLFVSLEQAFTELAAGDRRQLPGVVDGVADAAVHPLAGKRGRQMRGVAVQ